MNDLLRGVAFVALLGTLACESPLAPGWDGQPLLRTEGTEFQLSSPNSTGMFATIPYYYSNRTGRKVLLSNCNGDVSPSLEKKQGSEWVTAWVPLRDLCLSPPIKIQPGEVFQETLQLFAFEFGSNGGPQFAFEDVEGVYRLRWDMANWEKPVQGGGLPLKLRVSNEFTLRSPQAVG